MKNPFKINKPKLLKRMLAIVTILVLLIMYKLTNNIEKQISCANIAIQVIYPDNIKMLTEKEVFDIIGKYCTADSSVDANWVIGLESKLESNPFVLKADVFKSLTGKVRAKVTTKQALFRVYNTSGNSFYIDRQGNTIPVSTNDASRVVVANGNIRTKYFDGNIFENDSAQDVQKLRDIFELITWASTHPLWNAQIEQVYVNQQNDIELIPKVGMSTIVLGEISNYQKKLNKLEFFYKEILSRGDWNICSVLDLRFKDQIVCKQI